MRFISRLFLVVLFPLSCLAQSSISDSAGLKNLVSSFNAFSTSHINEKVYVHIDKPSYLPGDTIWYKAYTVIGAHHQLSILSGVLHVELINQKDSVISRQAIQLISGTAGSDIPLPSGLKDGLYRIRAYTRWMRNAGPDYFYDRQIRIGFPEPSSSLVKQNLASKPDVQFFPEGGQLVNGVRSRIAVKSVGANGLGEDIKGTIEDNEGNVVADFATRHLGMGVFALIPQSGKTYKAKIAGTGEASFTVDLPQAAEEGLTLAINNSQKDTLFIKVAANEKTVAGEKNNTFYLLAQSGGKIYYTAQEKLDGPVYTAAIEKSRFPTGIVQFTLFSQNGEPVAERIAFIRSADTLKLGIASATTVYTTRQEVNINFDVKDKDDKPVTGNFSISVINEDLVAMDEAAEGTIMNNLLLTSDLKGYIEKPNYYFINPGDETNADLDVLMLTQGYRRFEWKQVLNGTVPQITWQPEKGLELEGTVKTQAGNPVSNGKVTLAAIREGLFKDTLTDAEGQFRFTGLYLSDTSKVLLHAIRANNSGNVKIEVKQTDDPPVIPQKEININNASNFSPALLTQLRRAYNGQKEHDSLNNVHHLKEVKIWSGKLNQEPDVPFSANLNGPGHADQIIMGDKLTGCIYISDCLLGKIAGVFYQRGKFYTMRAYSDHIKPIPMVIIVDGNLQDESHLNDLNAEDVNSIEVLISGNYLAMYGSNAAGGALVITTKKGNKYVNSKTPSDLMSFLFKGFYLTKSFYSPKYKHPKTETEAADLRSTIYWNPNINTDKDGKASFEYFNADTKGTYRVVIEGIDDDGNLGRKVFRYKVE